MDTPLQFEFHSATSSSVQNATGKVLDIIVVGSQAKKIELCFSLFVCFNSIYYKRGSEFIFVKACCICYQVNRNVLVGQFLG